MGRAGTCAVVVIITRGVVFTAHVGDCRAVLLKDAITVGNKGTTTMSSENIEHHEVDMETKTNGSRASKRIKLDSKSPTKSPNKSTNENGKGGVVLSPTNSSPQTSIQGSSQSTTHTQNQQHGGGEISYSSDFILYDSFMKEVEDAKKSQQPLLSSQTSLKRSTRTRPPSFHEKNAADFCATFNGLLAQGTTLYHFGSYTDPDLVLTLLSSHPTISQVPI